jgi:predicted ATPase
LKGELTLQQGHLPRMGTAKSTRHKAKGKPAHHPGADTSVQAEAEACSLQALEVARGQGAKAWELRAATSLAQFCQGQGKRTEARELRAGIYDWFTEGFDTEDLQEVKALRAE